MTPQEFLDTVIKPALRTLRLDALNRRQILLGTAIHEDKLQDTPQIHGPALGPFQMEPATHDDIWKNYLTYHPALAQLVRSLLPSGVEPASSLLLHHPQYAAAMACLVYLRVPSPIPDDLNGQAAYYKLHYNTPSGKATVQEYLDDWNRALAANPVNFTDDEEV